MLLVCILPVTFLLFSLWRHSPNPCKSVLSSTVFHRLGKVKVTGKNKKGKKLSKTLKCAVTVKTPSIAVDKNEANIVVGGTEKLTASVKPASAQSSVTYTTSDEKVATVAADGTVTGVAAGEATVTATAKVGTNEVTATTKVTVKKTDFQSVKQTKANTVEAVILGDTSDVKAENIKITNTATNVIYAVKEMKQDSADKTKFTVETYMDMKDGKEYKVEIDGTEKSFTATDGVVAAVGLDKTEITAATETKISAETKDANGVVLDTVAFPGNGTVVIDINVTDGYTTADGLYLNEAGKTATADITYHSGKYDTNGAETGNVEAKGIVITAVDAATISGWTVKVGKDTATNYSDAEATKLAVDDTEMAAYIQMTDSKNNTSVDITGYTVESSNNDALIVGAVNAANGKVALTPVKAGTSYLVVKDDKGNVVTTLAVEIVAKRTATTLELDKTAVNLVQNIDGSTNETADITLTLKDQYGENVDASTADFKTLTFNNGTTTVNNNTDFDADAAVLTNGKYSIDSAGKTAGTYVVRATVGSLSRTFTVNIKDANDATTGADSYILEMSSASADAVIKADMASDTVITAQAYKTKGGVKVATVTSGAIEVKLTDSTGAEVTNGKAGYTVVNVNNTDADGKITIKVTDKTSGKKLAAGTYRLAITGTVSFTRSITITDSQPKVTVKRVATSGNSLDACFEFTYEGKKVTVENFADGVDIKYYTSADAQITGTGTHAVSYAVVKITLASGVNVEQKVSIGNTVTIN